jgi:hypothetical protein
MSNHTPGPWYAIPHPEHPHGKSRIDNDPYVPWGIFGQIAYVAPNNAHLIAAAPELLAVLEELRESASYWSEYDVPLGIVERIESAIAKARGEE